MIFYKRKQFNKNIKHWFPKNNFFFKLDNIYSYGIISNSSSYISKNQIESCRKIIVRIFRTQRIKPKLQICVKFLINQTVKSKGARMGSGKGDFKTTVSKIKKSDFLFKFKNISFICAYVLFKKLKYKLPIKLGFARIISSNNAYLRFKSKCIR